MQNSRNMPNWGEKSEGRADNEKTLGKNKRNKEERADLDALRRDALANAIHRREDGAADDVGHAELGVGSAREPEQQGSGTLGQEVDSATLGQEVDAVAARMESWISR